ncbi:hypothetical protein AK812_SmicGene9917 [Symbiodinium microadriaticum]|uniref:Uncharacterized protein n=1 Tax=Symbiodinium microadriaticum TaxID=2951 RepID=A0A1Q9EH87_SYMMI|nr:hypothetical protein AK812_SmicGene9917 [Symbiodinium microadriaticum]
MDIHQQVPAERWCITKREFFSFVNEVRKIWRRGALPDSAEHPNPKHQLADYGPNLYQVNVHYIKPVTLAAGGMSYALMKHPEGLICHVFVSHTWAEGVFELSNHVRRAWPRGLGLVNLYCCLLGNPQNLDIEALLDGPPIESPFAKALQSASHVLVMPNDTVSIYKRLWCVYEIYLATDWGKTCIIPARPPSSVLRATLIWTIFLPSTVGHLLGVAWAATAQLQKQHSAVHSSVVDGMLGGCIGLLFCISCVDFLHKFQVKRLLKVAQVCGALSSSGLIIRIMRISVQLLACSCIAPWMILPSGFSSLLDQALHYSVPIGVWAASAVMATNEIGEKLEHTELRRQASFLSFNGLEDATCSSPVDESRIRAAIADFEEDVIAGIEVLKSAGAFNTSIRRARTRGLDIEGSGNTHLDIRLVSGICAGWTVCTIEELATLHIWRDCPFLSDTWILVFALIVLLSMGGMFVACCFWNRYGPDRVNLIIPGCLWISLFADFFPFLLAMAQGLDELGRFPFFFRFAHTPTLSSCPSTATWFATTPLRPILALLALAWAWLSPFTLGSRGDLATS